MNKKILLSNVFLCAIITTTAWCYNWPIKPFNGPHGIYGTLGEYRTGHLHAGVDIGCVAETETYPIDTGTAFRVGTGYDAGVKVGSKDYIHLVENTRIDDDPDGDGVPEGASVTAFQTIIGYAATTHVHFEENNGANNPLRSGGLNNFSDSSNPTINSVDVVKQGSGDSFPTTASGMPIVSEQVDIKSNAKDSMSNGSATVAPYKIGYEIKRESGQTVVAETFKITFNTISGYSLSLIYASGSTSSNYNYWVTNSPTANQWWDTTGLDDDTYKIKVIVEDIKQNRAESEISVIIDKTPPNLSNIDVQPDPTNTNPDLSATAVDLKTNIISAEYFLDGNDPGQGNGIAMTSSDGAFDELSEQIQGTIDISDLPEGQHSVHVRAKDAANNWSEVAMHQDLVGDPHFVVGQSFLTFAKYSHPKQAFSNFYIKETANV